MSVLKYITCSALLMVIAVSGCKKETTAPPSGPSPAPSPAPPPMPTVYVGTVTPDSYLPVTPGSWWRYQKRLSGHVDTVIFTAGGYALDSIIIRDTLRIGYVPYFFGRMWGYTRNTCYAEYSGSKVCNIPELSETVGDNWVSDFSTSTKTYYKQRVSQKDLTVTVGDSVYFPVIEMQSYRSDMISGTYMGIRHYAKNIGLVYAVGLTPYTVLDTLTLIDYSIKP